MFEPVVETISLSIINTGKTGDVLRNCRESAGLTLDALAVKTGLSKSLLAKLEQGERSFTGRTVYALKQALNE